jgi:hypothetical protein
MRKAFTSGEQFEYCSTKPVQQLATELRSIMTTLVKASADMSWKTVQRVNKTTSS